MERCNICKAEVSKNNIRMGVCWDCATAESIISDGTDMYDEPGEPVKTPREKLALLIQHGWMHSGMFSYQERAQHRVHPTAAGALASADNSESGGG